MTRKIIAKDKEHLSMLIRDEIKIKGQNCNLNHIDVSQVTDMSDLFWYQEFNGDISEWDVSKVEYMVQMFADSKFNGDISKWNVSSVKQMQGMFFNAKFNQNISKWNVSSVENMNGMFEKSEFDKDLSSWIPSNLLEDKRMFYKCTAPTPYWANLNSIDERTKVIKSHLLFKSLDLTLEKNSSQEEKKKTKI